VDRLRVSLRALRVMRLALFPSLFVFMFLWSGSDKVIFSSAFPSKYLSFSSRQSNVDFRLSLQMDVDARNFAVEFSTTSFSIMGFGEEKRDAAILTFSGQVTTYVTRFSQLGKDQWSDSVKIPMLFHPSSPTVAPYDLLMSPKIVIGVGGNSLLAVVELGFELPIGYVATLRAASHRTLTAREVKEILAEDQPIDSTRSLFYSRTLDEISSSIGLQNYYCFDFIIIRSSDQMVLLSLYMLSALCLLFVCYFLTDLKLKKVEDRLRTYSGVALALFAFIWGFRQTFPRTITYWEGIILSWIIAWGVFEVTRAVYPSFSRFSDDSL